MHSSISFVSNFGCLTRFGGFKRSSIVALVAFMLGFCGNQRAHAGGITINTPAGLTPGQTFRIAFVTDATTQATSTDINYYNSFVNADATTEAGGGSVTYNGTPLTFSAVASTQAVAAITNIGQKGAPVYLASGLQIADSDTSAPFGLWSGGLLAPLDVDLTGTLTRGQIVWTGTTVTGAPAPTSELGYGTPPLDGTGVPFQSGGGWIMNGVTVNSATYPLYGISQPLTVAPEPSTLVLGALGTITLLAIRRRR
jgi:hypothetical protein